jgi:hypothetical protein
LTKLANKRIINPVNKNIRVWPGRRFLGLFPLWYSPAPVAGTDQPDNLQVKMTDEKITFSCIWHKDKDIQPLEWLQYIADEFSELADSLSFYDSNDIEERIKAYQEENPDIDKMEMYNEITCTIGETLLIEYLSEPTRIIKEIENVRQNILKAFEDCVIFPNLLKAIGIIESVISIAKDLDNSFYYYLYYSVVSTPEEAKEIFGERAKERFKENPELTIEDYENAFDCITELIETIKNNQYSAKLSESAWAILGYCKLKVGSEKYTEVEEQIKKERESKTEYSLPLSMKKWAEILGFSENKMKEIREEAKTYHFKQVCSRKWQLPKYDLPAEYLEKYRSMTKQKPQ